MKTVEKKAGVVEAIEEEKRTMPTLSPSIVGPLPAEGMLVMTEKDLNEYMTFLSQNGGKGLSESERFAEAILKKSIQSLNDVGIRLQKIEKEIEVLKIERHKFVGKIEAVGTVLQLAEDKRRFDQLQKKK